MGKFIVLEGGEGAGKSTVLRELKTVLPVETTVFTREPGGTPLAEELRNLIFDEELGKKADPKTLFGLFWAARADHMHKVIIPALREGKDVICDRFDASTFAYQVWGPQIFYLEPLFGQMRDVYCCPEPNWYIFLDVLPLVGVGRSVQANQANHIERKGSVFHTHVHDGFIRFFESHACDRYTVVDANQSLSAVIHQAIRAVREALAQ